eukprot:7860463-Pyramimonas_sp.AAC.1
MSERALEDRSRVPTAAHHTQFRPVNSPSPSTALPPAGGGEPGRLPRRVRFNPGRRWRWRGRSRR